MATPRSVGVAQPVDAARARDEANVASTLATANGRSGFPAAKRRDPSGAAERRRASESEALR